MLPMPGSLLSLRLHHPIYCKGRPLQGPASRGLVRVLLAPHRVSLHWAGLLGSTGSGRSDTSQKTAVQASVLPDLGSISLADPQVIGRSSLRKDQLAARLLGSPSGDRGRCHTDSLQRARLLTLLDGQPWAPAERRGLDCCCPLCHVSGNTPEEPIFSIRQLPRVV